MQAWELHSVIFTSRKWQPHILTQQWKTERNPLTHSFTPTDRSMRSILLHFLSLWPSGCLHVTTWVTSGAQIATSVSLTHSLAPLPHSPSPSLQEAPSLSSPSLDSIKWLKSCVKNTGGGKQDEGELVRAGSLPHMRAKMWTKHYQLAEQILKGFILSHIQCFIKPWWVYPIDAFCLGR